MKIARRILWNIYAVPMTLLLLSTEVLVMFQYPNPFVIPFTVLDFCISFPGIVAMHLHIWDQPSFRPAVWKIYAFIFLAWDFTANLLIEPALTREPLGFNSLIGFLLMIPLYVAVFRYAFRKWAHTGDYDS
jgi:hypothetical protein